jgi:hypothetical protein
MLCADIIGIPPRTPGAQVAAELSPRAWTLQDRYPGVSVRAPHQKEAHTKRWPRPHWLDDDTHADTNKAEAAPIEPRTLGRLVLILAGAVSYGTVTFRKKLGF